jgi:hypothetical protein
VLYQLSYSHRQLDYTTALRCCQKPRRQVARQFQIRASSLWQTLCKTFDSDVTDDLDFANLIS